MKKKELEKRLKKLGWYLLRQGGRHETWTNGEADEPVPGHPEISQKDSQESAKTPGRSAMMFEGHVWKDGKLWLVEIAALDLMTQGSSRRDALEMIQDAICELVDDKRFKLKLDVDKEGKFFVSSSNICALFSLFLKRQRLKHGLTIRDVAKKMNSKSPTAYSQYESGKVVPTVAQAQKLIKWVGAAQDGLAIKVG